MRDPNEYQIGGGHYKTAYEHWDLVLNTGIGYLEGCATKYLARWRKAGKPNSDLEKALHYTEKLLNTYRVSYPRLRAPQRMVRKEVANFIMTNKIPEADAYPLIALITWETLADLQLAHASILALITELQAAVAPSEDPKPVPLEDSNRHADRA